MQPLRTYKPLPKAAPGKGPVLILNAGCHTAASSPAKLALLTAAGAHYGRGDGQGAVRLCQDDGHPG
jgi:hypothetical protein